MSKNEGKKNNITITMSKNQLTFLEKFSQKNKPLESCAILVGNLDNYQYKVIDIIQMENSDKSEIRFSINEEKLFALYKEIESMNLSIVGIFHSHPSIPFPSKTDIQYMQINPVPWIITSTINGDTKCFIFDEKEEILKIDLLVMD
jgi:proteasome lid subunit RPN8/RPN11